MYHNMHQNCCMDGDPTAHSLSSRPVIFVVESPKTLHSRTLCRGGHCYTLFHVVAPLHIPANIYILSESLPFDNWTQRQPKILFWWVFCSVHTQTQSDTIMYTTNSIFFTLLLCRCLYIIFFFSLFPQFIEMLCCDGYEIWIRLMRRKKKVYRFNQAFSLFGRMLNHNIKTLVFTFCSSRVMLV